MSHTPPVPQASQSPFPLQEAPQTAQPAATASAPAADTVRQGMTAAQDAVGPLVGKAKAFARERPYATAALVGTIALAVINTLRGRSAG